MDTLKLYKLKFKLKFKLKNLWVPLRGLTKMVYNMEIPKYYNKMSEDEKQKFNKLFDVQLNICVERIRKYEYLNADNESIAFCVRLEDSQMRFLDEMDMKYL